MKTTKRKFPKITMKIGDPSWIEEELGWEKWKE